LAYPVKPVYPLRPVTGVPGIGVVIVAGGEEEGEYTGDWRAECTGDVASCDGVYIGEWTGEPSGEGT